MNSQLNVSIRKRYSLPSTILSRLFSGSLAFIISATLTFNSAYAAVSATYTAVPPTSAAAGTSTPPLTMLVMSNDHQLFYKAYSDWSDLDGDGSIENTYKHSFDYYGYFDSYKCYDYDGTNNRFSPQAITADKYCTGSSNSYWSGNFLNWASMTRMDIMRKVLYGGKRSTDTAALTVLERAFLPTDAHSFAKYYTGSDIDALSPFSNTVTEITMCNTTYDSSAGLESQDSTNPPLLRAAEGNYRFWAANERFQCTWSTERGIKTNGYTTDPVSATVGLTDGSNGPDYIVRVEACVSAALEGKEKCQAYPSANLKPVGLLHEFGESDQIKFGLLTGSYKNNKSGGVVRKDISSFAGEVNVATDGTFTGVAGIVTTIDLFRIHGYRYGTANSGSDGRYNDDDTCPWGRSEFAEGNCSNWGNPASEMYLEAVRYFAGLNRNNTFSTNANDDNGYITGLTNVGNWADPLDDSNYCASCSIIILNTSDFSYDSDSLSLAGLDGAASGLDAFTDAIGVAEGLTTAGTEWFIGENGIDNNQLCTGKTIANMSSIKGSCPNSPRLEGSYQIAGIAHYANTNDIRGLTDDQKVQTFAVSLASSAPQLKIPVQDSLGNFVADKFINIIPACRDKGMVDLSGSSLPGNCAIVDFKILVPFTTSAGGNATGTVAVIWEDTEQGGDYDQDMSGTIKYDITPTSVTVTTDVIQQSTGFEMAFGYVIGGTTQDGFRAHSGINSYDYSDPDGLNDCTDCATGDAASNQAYTIGTSTAQLIQDPLWYAAKWGGFTDTDADNTPNLVNEWDRINNITEAIGSDGVPDNYFKSDNPAVLVSQLNTIFGKLLKRTSAGSAAAVITDSISTVGSVYQALYQPKREKQGLEVSWVGQIHSIFIDAYGHLREDTNEDKKLDTSDEYILVKYSDDFERTQIWYCSPSAADKISSVPFTEAVCPRTDRKEISELKPVWNANYELAKFSATDSRLTAQRNYTTPFTDSSNGGRHILTWQDLDGDNEIDSDEIVDFTADNFTDVNGSGIPTKAGLLDVANSGVPADDLTKITNIVNFIRGYEDPATTGFRSRTIDFRPTTGDEVWRMGDIIHSSPVAIGPPSGTAYGSDVIEWNTFGDSTYTTFKEHYKDRRTVLYVGANDGLVHAYNAGFYNVADQEYCLDLACNNNSSASHTLGAEMWAYAPRNLLPQLKFLTEPNYPHVYYMDGEPRTFDVNIFDDDADHPGGWGTILVTGMEFGGGAHSPITVDVDNTGATTFTTGSAYVIFDITNPEVAPKVLGEFTHPDLGFTTSSPTLLVKRAPDANNNWAAAGTSSYPNDFRLVFGSGPNALSTGTSTQTAKLFMVKLEMDGDVLDLSASNQIVKDTGLSNSFIGDPTAKNWNNDFLFDAVYFGVAGGTELAPDGRLMRLALNTNDPTNWGAPTTMLNTAQPFLNMPAAKVIENPATEENENWVFAGSGRLYTTNDNYSNTQQSFYGLREEAHATYPNSPADKLFSTDPANANYIQNVTGVQVFRYGDIDANALAGELPMVTFSALELHIDTKAGWFRNFSIPSSSERDLARATLFGNLVIFPTYIPNTNICLAEGNSKINAVYQRTGTGYPGEVFTDEDSYFGSDTTNWESLPSVDYGFGLVSEITIKKNIDNSITLVCTTSTGEICNTLPPDPIPCPGNNCTGDTGRQSWREILLF